MRKLAAKLIKSDSQTVGQQEETRQFVRDERVFRLRKLDRFAATTYQLTDKGGNQSTTAYKPSANAILQYELMKSSNQDERGRK